MTRKLWVKFKNNNSTLLSSEGCENVYDFIEACKKKLQIKYQPQELFLSLTVDGPSIGPNLKMSQLSTLDGYTVNDDKHPLFIVILTQFEVEISSKSNLLLI